MEGGGDVDVFALCFDRSDRDEADEEDVVRRTGFGWPFGDGEVLALFGPRTFAVGEVYGVGSPADSIELLIDEFAGFGLIEHERGSGGRRGGGAAGGGTSRFSGGGSLEFS